MKEGRETLTCRELEMGKSTRDWFVSIPRVMPKINFLPAKDPFAAIVDESSKTMHLFSNTKAVKNVDIAPNGIPRESSNLEPL